VVAAQGARHRVQAALLARHRGGRPSFPDQYETYNIDATGNLVKETLGNPFLRPELATETEAGVDLIVRDRYSLQVSRARTTVTDQLLLLPLPAPAGGFESQWQNAGTLKGNTWEGTFEARLVQRPRVTWSLGWWPTARATASPSSTAPASSRRPSCTAAPA
jgi:hypothetical protein